MEFLTYQNLFTVVTFTSTEVLLWFFGGSFMINLPVILGVGAAYIMSGPSSSYSGKFNYAALVALMVGISLAGSIGGFIGAPTAHILAMAVGALMGYSLDTSVAMLLGRLEKE